jgi:hypothetical protein
MTRTSSEPLRPNAHRCIPAFDYPHVASLRVGNVALPPVVGSGLRPRCPSTRASIPVSWNTRRVVSLTPSWTGGTPMAGRKSESSASVLSRAGDGRSSSAVGVEAGAAQRVHGGGEVARADQRGGVVERIALMPGGGGPDAPSACATAAGSTTPSRRLRPRASRQRSGRRSEPADGVRQVGTRHSSSERQWLSPLAAAPG